MNFKFSKVAATLGHGCASRRMGPSRSVTSAGEAILALTERESKFAFEEHHRERMLDRCVVVNCGNIGDPPNLIYIQIIPFFGDSQPKALKQWKKCVDFVNLKRAQWQNTKYSIVCLEHLRRDVYIHWYPKLPGLETPPVPNLRRERLGCVVFPMVQLNKASDTPQSSQTKRKV